MILFFGKESLQSKFQAFKRDLFFPFFFYLKLLLPSKIIFTRESIQDYIIHSRMFLVVKVIHILLESQLNAWSRPMTTPKQS